jgi:hypothetical protein
MTDPINPEPLPDQPVWDMETGLCLNMDASKQDAPFWWVHQPDRYQTFLSNRKKAGIEFHDVLPTYVAPKEPAVLNAGVQSMRPR